MACNIYSSLTDLENSNVYEASLSSVFIWGDSIDQIQLKGQWQKSDSIFRYVQGYRDQPILKNEYINWDTEEFYKYSAQTSMGEWVDIFINHAMVNAKGVIILQTKKAPCGAF